MIRWPATLPGVFSILIVLLMFASVGTSPAQAPAKGEQTERQLYTEVLGTMCGAHLMHCQESIGMLADARSAKAYTDAEAQKRLKALVGLMAGVDGQLAKLVKFEKDRGDKDATGNTIEIIRSINQQMRNQATELEAFWKTNDQNRFAAYQKARQEAVKGAQKLGIKLSP